MKANLISRRQLLVRGTAAGGLAILGVPTLSFAQQAGAKPEAAAKSALDELTEKLRGDLIAPSDTRYNAERKVWNGMIDKHPSAIARCSGVADVVDVVRFARDKDMAVSVRGGGHNVAGKALKDGAIAIDLSPMNFVRIDPKERTARAGGGARWAALDRESLALDLVTTGGTVSSTGVGGLTLGGGLGWLMRKHGLACDNLVSADVVTADGRILVASASENRDLFWALRGGGGNFGVVTSFEFKLHPLEPVIGGLAMYPQSMLRDMLRFYRDYTSKLPDSVTTMCGVLNGPPGTPVAGQSAGFIALCHSGSVRDGERLLQPVADFATPSLGGFGPTTYAAMQTMYDAGAGPGNRNYWRSNFLMKLSDEVINLIVTQAEQGVRGPGTLVLLEHMGGAITRVGDHATAFSNRGARHNLSILSSWPNPADDEENIRWTRAFGDAVKPFATGAGYVNYMTGDESAERVQATYKANLERLIEIKRKYDPENFFNANQNIVP